MGTVFVLDILGLVIVCSLLLRNAAPVIECSSLLFWVGMGIIIY